MNYKSGLEGSRQGRPRYRAHRLVRLIFVAALSITALGCATSATTGTSAIDIIVKVDRSLEGGERAAQRFSQATGCTFQFVRPMALEASLYRVVAHTDAGGANECLSKLRGLAGVIYAVPDERMEAQPKEKGMQ